MGLLLASHCWDTMKHSRWSNTEKTRSYILLFPISPDTGSPQPAPPDLPLSALRPFLPQSIPML